MKASALHQFSFSFHLNMKVKGYIYWLFLCKERTQMNRMFYMLLCHYYSNNLNIIPTQSEFHICGT